MSPGGGYIVFVRVPVRREASEAHLVRSFIDFQQFLKNKMAATANFLLTQNFDDVRSIKGKVMNISSPNILCGYKMP